MLKAPQHAQAIETSNGDWASVEARLAQAEADSAVLAEQLQRADDKHQVFQLAMLTCRCSCAVLLCGKIQVSIVCVHGCMPQMAWSQSHACSGVASPSQGW